MPEEVEESFIDDVQSLPAPKTSKGPKQKPAPKPVEEESEDDGIHLIPIATPVSKLDVDKENRPMVKEYRADGSSPRRRRAISMGLSELILPPYTKNVIATYRLKQSDRIDPSTKEIPEPGDAYFPGSYTFFDKYEKDPLLKSKLIVNPGPQRVTVNDKGQQERTYDILPIEFTNGVLQVNVEKEYAKYVFMELHPNNGSNRHRTNEATAEFERTDLKMTRTSAFIQAEQDLADDASMAVRDIKNRDLIIGYATDFGIPTYQRDPGDIKNELREKARLNPRKFYGLAKNLAPAITLNIHTGMAYGIIAFDADRNKFKFVETDQEFHVVLINEDPIQSLTKAIIASPEKRELYEEMTKMINYWE